MAKEWPTCPCLCTPFTLDGLPFPPLTLCVSFQLLSICPGCALPPHYLAWPFCLLAPHLTVVWGQLVQQLLDPVFFPGTVDVGNLILWETAEKLVYLGRCRGRERTIETRGELGCSGMVGPYFSENVQVIGRDCLLTLSTFPSYRSFPSPPKHAMSSFRP